MSRLRSSGAGGCADRQGARFPDPSARATQGAREEKAHAEGDSGGERGPSAGAGSKGQVGPAGCRNQATQRGLKQKRCLCGFSCALFPSSVEIKKTNSWSRFFFFSPLCRLVKRGEVPLLAPRFQRKDKDKERKKEKEMKIRKDVAKWDSKRLECWRRTLEHFINAVLTL